MKQQFAALYRREKVIVVAIESAMRAVNGESIPGQSPFFQRFPSTLPGVARFPGAAPKAPAAVAPKRRYGAPRRRKGWRTPRRFAHFGSHRVTRQRLGLRWP